MTCGIQKEMPLIKNKNSILNSLETDIANHLYSRSRVWQVIKLLVGEEKSRGEVIPLFFLK